MADHPDIPTGTRTPDEADPTDETRRSARHGWGSRPTLLVAAVVVFFLSTWGPREFLALPVAVALTLLGAYLLWNGHLGRVAPSAPALLAVGLLVYDLFLPRVLHHPAGVYPVGRWHLIHTLAWLVAGAVVLRLIRSRRDRGWWLLPGLLVLTTLSGASLITITPQPPIDVWQLHQQAGEALLDGENPYADIRVVSTFASDADSAEMIGYAYPPIGLLSNGVAGAILGDARWASLAAWLAVITVAGRRLRRSGSYGASLLFLLAAQPAWYLVLEAAYSEPVSIALLVAGLLWLHRPYLGPIVLGLGLGSKQYLVALLPLVVIVPALTFRQRVVTAATAVTALALGLTWGVSEYIDAAFLFHLRVPPQETAANLYGLFSGFGVGATPVVVVAALVVAATVILGRGADTGAKVAVAAASVLSIAFLFSPQAFANYWLVVAVLILISLIPEPNDPVSMPSGDSGHRRQRETGAG